MRVRGGGVPGKGLRGFALLSAAERVERGRRGGTKAWDLGKAHAFTASEASAAGKIGGPAKAAKTKKER